MLASLQYLELDLVPVSYFSAYKWNSFYKLRSPKASESSNDKLDYSHLDTFLWFNLFSFCSLSKRIAEKSLNIL